MNRRTIIAGNWKMNLGKADAVELARGIAGTPIDGNIDVAVFPTFPWLVPVADALEGSDVILGAQDTYIEPSGAFTGEVSPIALAELCQAVLAGHSERRHVIGESNELVGRKLAAILAAGMTGYLCVGETLDEREAGRADEIVEHQLSTGLAGVEQSDLERIVIAYEPVWAIGTGVAASADDAQSMCGSIRKWMNSHYGATGAAVRVLYGGSMSPGNVDELLAGKDIDGGLVGGASLDARSFGELISAAARRAAV